MYFGEKKNLRTLEKLMRLEKDYVNYEKMFIPGT
jgi:hypothetical protein